MLSVPDYVSPVPYQDACKHINDMQDKINNSEKVDEQKKLLNELQRFIYDLNIKLIKDLGMDERDFLYNCILAVYNKVCYESTGDITRLSIVRDYQNNGKRITYAQINSRQQQINDTKQRIEQEGVCSFPINKLQYEQLKMSLNDDTLHEEPEHSYDGFAHNNHQNHYKRNTPMLKISSYENMDNYTKNNLKEHIDFFKERTIKFMNGRILHTWKRS